MTIPDPARVPVILGTGQAIERDDAVTSRDLMERAAWRALDEAAGVGPHLEEVVVVKVLSDDFPRPATAVARRLGLGEVRRAVTVVGGNHPTWLVTRAAEAIAAGELSATLLVGAEAAASAKRGDPGPDPDADLRDGAPDEVLGIDALGFGPAERAISLYLPIHVYPMFESVMADEAGRSFADQRRFVAEFMARATQVAAAHPYAWFPQAATADELATASDTNRLVAEPYTKRLNAILAVDQAAAVVVTSLAVARQLGLEDQAVYVWSGADATEVWCPVQRPHLGRSEGIAAAGTAAMGAAGVGIDDLAHLDLYSCFPCAVEAGAGALGVALDDPRGLTVTGGLAYFGGPGNNYTMHAVATLAEQLRQGGGLGLCTGLGWFTTKHSISILGAAPPPGGFRRGDTAAAQAAIDAGALPVAEGDDALGAATVVAATVIYDRDGTPSGAPVFAQREDGRRVAARAHPDLVGTLAGVSLVGSRIEVVDGDPPTYVVAESS